MTKIPAALNDYRTLLAHRLLVLSNTLGKGAVRLYAREFGVPLAEWRLLATLAIAAPASVTDLALKLGTDKGWVSRTAKALLDKGLVSTETDLASSTRRFQLQLTPAGRDLYDRIQPAAAERNRKLVGILTSDEAEVFDRCLVKLQKQAEALTASGGSLQDGAGATSRQDAARVEPRADVRGPR